MGKSVKEQSLIPKWDSFKLSDLIDFKNGINYSSGEAGHLIKVVGVKNFGDKRINSNTLLDNIELSNIPNEEYALKQGDLLFVRSNGNKELVGRIVLIEENLDNTYYSGFIIRGRIKDLNKVIPEYLLGLEEQIKSMLLKKTGGTNITNLSQVMLNECVLKFPPIEIQREIVNVLSTWDKAIELKETLLAKKQQQKQGLMQQLLTGKKRLPGFEGEWEKIRLNDFLTESNRKTTKNNQYRVLSVTKNGIVPQNEHFKKQIASEDNIGYKIIERNNLAFSTMNLWMGSLDILKNYDIGIVSPAYKIFKINDSKVDIHFIDTLLKSEKLIWIYNINSEQGASVVRRNLDIQSLLNTIILLPKLEEQKALGLVFKTVNEEIQLLEREIVLLKEQKQGLTQVLLTGKVCVSI